MVAVHEFNISKLAASDGLSLESQSSSTNQSRHKLGTYRGRNWSQCCAGSIDRFKRASILMQAALSELHSASISRIYAAAFSKRSLKAEGLGAATACPQMMRPPCCDLLPIKGSDRHRNCKGSCSNAQPIQSYEKQNHFMCRGSVRSAPHRILHLRLQEHGTRCRQGYRTHGREDSRQDGMTARGFISSWPACP